MLCSRFVIPIKQDLHGQERQNRADGPQHPQFQGCLSITMSHVALIVSSPEKKNH